MGLPNDASKKGTTQSAPPSPVLDIQDMVFT
jgi:hypothetical protein